MSFMIESSINTTLWCVVWPSRWPRTFWSLLWYENGGSLLLILGRSWISPSEDCKGCIECPLCKWTSSWLWLSLWKDRVDCVYNYYRYFEVCCHNKEAGAHYCDLHWMINVNGIICLTSILWKQRWLCCGNYCVFLFLFGINFIQPFHPF